MVAVDIVVVSMVVVSMVMVIDVVVVVAVGMVMVAMVMVQMRGEWPPGHIGASRARWGKAGSRVLVSRVSHVRGYTPIREICLVGLVATRHLVRPL